MDREKTRAGFLCIALLLAALQALGAIGCNLWGGIDKPSEVQDLYSVAVAKADSGDCSGAANILSAISHPPDKVYVALGWAYLCMSGATAANVASSVYNYKSGSGTYTVFGTLARTMLPMSPDKLTDPDLAIAAFSGIQDGFIRNIELGIAEIVKVSAILANQATISNDSSLTQADISVAGCIGVNCSGAGVAACTANASGAISNGDITSIITTITDAATRLAATGAGDLQNLASQIQASLGAGGLLGRCFIQNNMIPVP